MPVRKARGRARKRLSLQELLSLRGGKRADWARRWGSMEAAKEVYRVHQADVNRAGGLPGRSHAWWAFDSGAPPEVWEEASSEREGYDSKATFDDRMDEDEEFHAAQYVWLIEHGHATDPGERAHIREYAEFQLSQTGQWGHTDRALAAWQTVVDALDREETG